MNEQDHGFLCCYFSGQGIRPATREEAAQSIAAKDGAFQVIEARTGLKRSVYVEGPR